MKKGFFITLLVMLVVTFFTTSTNIVFAAKKKNQEAKTLVVLSNAGDVQVYGSVLSPKEDEVNVLLTKTLLTKIRKVGLENLNINLTSALDSTKTYAVPSDALTIKRKALNKKAGKYLVISLFNLTTPSGITISPSSLPNDTYKLRIQGKELDATTDSFTYNTPALIVGTVDSSSTGLVDVEDLTGNKISEKTVAINRNGTFFTEVRANKITPETKARKILRKQVDDSETIEEDVVDEINTGVVRCVTDTEQLAIVPLNNKPDDNAALTNKPIEVNDGSTLTANLALESAKEGDEELALETAKGIVEDLKSDEDDDEEFFDEGEDFECDIGDIGQFADKCSDNEEILASIGRNFREFVTKASCNFPEFKLIKKIIPLLPESANVFIGKGYCEISKEDDVDRVCTEMYPKILNSFKRGEIDQLPCPPRHCDEFEYIKPPKCFEPKGFCDDHRGPEPKPFAQVCRGPNCGFEEPHDNCFHKPMRDLYCARIGADIKAEECQDDGFSGRYSPKWVIESDDEGNQYCVPSNIPKPEYSSGYQGPLPPSTPKEIANECKVNSCHKTCSEQYGYRGPVFGPPPSPSIPLDTNLKAQFIPPPYTGSKGNYETPQFQPSTPPQYTSSSISSEVPPPPPFIGPPEHFKCEECDCHRACDAEAGRLIECNDRDKYFSKKCCERGPGSIIFAQTYSAQSFPGGGFGPGRGPVGINAYDCLCKDTVNNFNQKGYVKSEAQTVCLESCPPGYEKSLNSDQCLPICDKEKGFVRDPGGICRKKCPEGSFDDGTGYCRCPEGQSIGKSGKCESSSTCPQYCYNYPSFRKLLASHDFTGSTGSTYSPPYSGGSGYTSPSTGPGYIPPGTSPGYIPPGSTGSTNAVPPECQRCIGTTTCSSNMLPNPNSNGEAQCICPTGLPYWDNNTSSCVATCPNGNPPASVTANYPAKSPISCNNSSTTTTNYCSPGIVPTAANPCTCNPSGGSYFNSGNTCTCPTNSGPYTKETGCSSSTSSRPCTAGEGPSNGCYCFGSGYTGTDGKCQCTGGAQYNGGGCGTSQGAYCTVGQGPSNGCQCNTQGGTIVGSNGQCQCPSGSSQSYSPASGCGSSTRPCTAGEGPSNGCYCFGSGYTGTDGKCQCTGGAQYNGGGCGTSSSNYCSPAIVPTAANPCTCNPSGGSYFNSSNTCTCPTNSGPYTKETGCASSNSCPPATPIKCSDGTCKATQAECSNTVTCPPPYITNPSGSPPCKCPDSTPIINGSTCVAACPSPLTSQAGPSGQQTCLCPGGTYPTNGTCPQQCTGGKIFDPAANSCRCPNNQVDNGSGSCVCPSGRIPNPNNSQGDCICPEGQENDPANPALLCRQTCKSEQTRDSAGICQCPTGRQNDPASSTGCSACPACLNGKVFNGAGCGCACPTGQVEGTNGVCVNQ